MSNECELLTLLGIVDDLFEFMNERARPNDRSVSVRSKLRSGIDGQIKSTTISNLNLLRHQRYKSN